MALLATMCRACRHPQCKPVEGSDLCAYCEDQIPCPVLKSVQVPPQPLPPHKPAPPVSPPHVKAEPVAKLCECGCGTDISGSAWKFVRGHKTKQELRASAPAEPVVPANGHGPQLRALDESTWANKYRRVIGGHARLIAQIEAAPIGFRGEIEFPSTSQLSGARHAMERVGRSSRAYRLHFVRNAEQPKVLGIFKEARV